jgi:hypothetical protein
VSLIILGWPSSDQLQPVVSDSKDELYAEDDLGFDPFHETQKALAEMLESESKLQNIYNSSQSPQNFSSNITSQQTLENVNHQVNGPSYNQSSSPHSNGGGMPNLPPGLPSSISSVPNSSVMNTGRLPLKQPPPGFGHQSLLSQDHSFGIGTHQNGGNISEGNNFQTAINQHPFGQQNDFLGGSGFPNTSSRSGLRNISGNGANGSLNFPQHSNHVQSMQQQMNHNHQHISDHPHRLGQQPSTSSSGNIGSVDHLQQQLRQLSFEKPNVQQSKDWQEGLRALLPNVNVSFGALPNNGAGLPGSTNMSSNQNSHSHIDLEARFNRSQPGSMSSNSTNHLLNDHSPHNLINSLPQQTGQNISHQTLGNQHPNHMNHMNHHAPHQQQHMNLQQQHNDRPQMQQHRSHTGILNFKTASCASRHTINHP